MARPDWDDWFLALAFTAAQRSLDPATKHGCLVVCSDHTVLSLGYNGPPRGQEDVKIPLMRPEKYKWFEHAESNAISNAARHGVPLRGSTFYITGEPCVECMRRIINVGAARVVYGPAQSAMITDEDRKVSAIMAASARVRMEKRRIEGATDTLCEARDCARGWRKNSAT